jgi:molybdate transport system ATP-binding protein
LALTVDIRKNLGSFRLDIRLESESGTLALLGASGCGKSMTLKCIAGIETPDEGKIILDGVTLFDSARKINLPPQKRKTGYLFQNCALFPNMTAARNILCGLHGEKDQARRQQRLRQLIGAFRLEGLEERYPAQLSGGQQQRVAIARILASEPKLILLDEPFSALDSHLKWQLEQELGELLSGFDGGVLLVSHNRNEVFRLSDSVAVLSGGRVAETGGKHEIFAAPRTYAACQLTGCKNISRITRVSDREIYAEDWGVTLRTGQAVTGERFAGIRASQLAACSDPDTENAFAYDLVKELEDPSGYIRLIRKKDAPEAALIRWELPREEYEAVRGFPHYAAIPPQKLLLLQENP